MQALKLNEKFYHTTNSQYMFISKNPEARKLLIKSNKSVQQMNINHYYLQYFRTLRKQYKDLVYKKFKRIYSDLFAKKAT